MQAESVTEDLRSRSKLPSYVSKVLASLPEGMHPMTQFSTLVLALQVGFSKGCVVVRQFDAMQPRAPFWAFD
jgi:citrate synthase